MDKLEPLNIQLESSEEELHRFYEKRHEKWVKTDGLSEASWKKNFPNGYDSWNDGKEGHSRLSWKGQQLVLDLLDQAVERINYLEAAVNKLRAKDSLEGVDSLLGQIRGETP